LGNGWKIDENGYHYREDKPMTSEELKEWWEGRIAFGWVPKSDEQKADVEGMIGRPLDIEVKPRRSK